MTTAYLITATITTPLYGKLSDIYGRKPLFLTAISDLHRSARWPARSPTSMYELAGVPRRAGARRRRPVLAGTGDHRRHRLAAGAGHATRATSWRCSPRRACSARSSAASSPARTSILGITGWRWVFLVNVPIGLRRAGVVAQGAEHAAHQTPRHRIDWPGALALALGLVPLLLVAEQGREWGWDSPASLTCYVHRRGRPGWRSSSSSPHRRRRAAAAAARSATRRSGGGSLAALIVGMGMFGGMAVLPLYLQIVKGATPTQAGLLIAAAGPRAS